MHFSIPNLICWLGQAWFRKFSCKIFHCPVTRCGCWVKSLGLTLTSIVYSQLDMFWLGQVEQAWFCKFSCEVFPGTYPNKCHSTRLLARKIHCPAHRSAWTNGKSHPSLKSNRQSQFPADGMFQIAAGRSLLNAGQCVAFLYHFWTMASKVCVLINLIYESLSIII